MSGTKGRFTETRVAKVSGPVELVISVLFTLSGLYLVATGSHWVESLAGILLVVCGLVNLSIPSRIGPCPYCGRRVRTSSTQDSIGQRISTPLVRCKACSGQIVVSKGRYWKSGEVASKYQRGEE